MVCSKDSTENVGALSKCKYKYLVGDMVFMDQYTVKTPDRFPVGYDHEADHNKFHGGTIFRDTTSKIIHVQNQVSLNASKTVNAKV